MISDSKLFNCRIWNAAALEIRQFFGEKVGLVVKSRHDGEGSQVETASSLGQKDFG